MSVQNFSFLARLEVAEKFVVGWGGGVVVVGWWSRPSLGFSFSQAEQNIKNDVNFILEYTYFITRILFYSVLKWIGFENLIEISLDQ